MADDSWGIIGSAEPVMTDVCDFTRNSPETADASRSVTRHRRVGLSSFAAKQGIQSPILKQSKF
jgi:hypothetical protein